MSDVKGSRFGFGAVQACRATSVSAKNGCRLAVPSLAEMLTTTPSSAASQLRAARGWPSKLVGPPVYWPVPSSAEMLTTTPSSAASQLRAARGWPLMVAAVRVSALVLEKPSLATE